MNVCIWKSQNTLYTHETPRFKCVQAEFSSWCCWCCCPHSIFTPHFHLPSTKIFVAFSYTHTPFSMWYFVFVQLFRMAYSVHALVSHVYLCEMFAFECFIFIAIIYCEPYSRTKTWYWVCFSFQFQLNSTHSNGNGWRQEIILYNIYYYFCFSMLKIKLQYKQSISFFFFPSN